MSNATGVSLKKEEGSIDIIIKKRNMIRIEIIWNWDREIFQKFVEKNESRSLFPYHFVKS